MRAEGMAGVVARRRRPRATIPGREGVRPRDLVERDFRAPAPNQLWVTDITYVELVGGGFCYTAFVVDVFFSRDRRVAGAGHAENRACATKRLVISLAQLGGIRRSIPGSNGLPRSERKRGTWHASEAAAVSRYEERGAAGPERDGES